MQLNFNTNELSFVVKRFKIGELMSFGPQKKVKEKDAIDSLLQKQYLIPYGEKYELSNELRLLFSVWEKIRYTVVREDYISKDHVFSLMANSKNILVYSEHFDDITVALSDFSAEVMDGILLDYLGIADGDEMEQGYNCVFQTEDFLNYFVAKKKDINYISAKTGLSADEIQEIIDALAAEDEMSLIVQDIVEDVGARCSVKRLPKAWIMIKHIVPNKALAKERVVVIKGNAEKIVDSIYVI